MENTTKKQVNTSEPASRMDFGELKRTFEAAYTAGGDYSDALTALSTAVAVACIKKCMDPQRKGTTSTTPGTPSDNGMNPMMVALRRGVYHDIHLLSNTAAAASAAMRTTYTADGDMVTVPGDPDAAAALADIMGDTLSDGIDMVHTAAAALLEQAAAHAGGENWLDTPYTVRRLARKVYIKLDDSRAYRDDTTTPIQEVYRAVRRAIEASRAVQVDPRNGYSYIEDMGDGVDGLETVYYRMGKYADIGGSAVVDGHTPGAPAGYSSGTALYTVGESEARNYSSILEALNLSRRQMEVIRLRMQGHGKKAIATYLGIDAANVGRVLRQVQAKAEKIGFTPSMWAEMKAHN